MKKEKKELKKIEKKGLTKTIKEKDFRKRWTTMAAGVKIGYRVSEVVGRNWKQKIIYWCAIRVLRLIEMRLGKMIAYVHIKQSVYWKKFYEEGTK